MSKSTKPKIDPREQLVLFKTVFIRFRIIIFVAFVAVVYGYLFLQINKFNNAKPDPLAATSQAASPSAELPHIDSTTVKKIQQLKDNSVNVQALFDQARQNPFASK